MSHESLAPALKNISETLIKAYYREIESYLNAQKDNLLETDVLVLISQVITAVATAQYHSIIDYLPKAPIDHRQLSSAIRKSLLHSFKAVQKLKPLGEKNAVE